jgi:hypothetical protein
VSEKLIDGVEMKLGRETYMVPSLTFKQLKQLEPQIRQLQSIGANGNELTQEQVDAVIDIAHTALKRNYPNMARQEVEDFLDLRVQAKLIRAVVGQVQPDSQS